MENNNRLMPHIRRTTHIMKFAHRNRFESQHLQLEV
ncbi:leader peptide SpeFL [Escherichia coli]